MLYGKSKKIYVFQYADRYKIGVSCNVNNRIKQLSCGCPGIKCIYESEYLDNPFMLESKIHKIHEEYSVGGEWFSFVDIDLIKETVLSGGKVIDIQEIKDRSRKSIKKSVEMFEKTISHYTNKEIEEKKSIQKMAFENMQIEKFAQSISGADIPNIYSDLIYNILFGEGTDGMISKYNPRRFESFRAKLTNEQNIEIDRLTKIVRCLINQYWSYEEIEEFVNDL